MLFVFLKKVRISICVLFLLSSVSTFAQLSLNGTVMTTDGDSAIAFAAVQLLDAKGEISAYGITDSNGKISLKTPPCTGCKLEIRHLNYKDTMLLVDVLKTKSFIVKLIPKENFIDEVFVEANAISGTVRNDTIEYNINALRSGKEDKLKDLLKKLPGVEVQPNGQVKVNGKTVDKLLINGQDFFEGNTQLAVENVSAKTVGGVSLLQNYQSSGSFSNLDKKENNALDITIKDEYMGKPTGEVQLGGALPGRYQGAISAFRFAKRNSISMVLLGNNVGEKGISLPTFSNHFRPLDREMNINSTTEAEKVDVPEFMVNREEVQDNTDYTLFLNYMQKPNTKIQNSGNLIFGIHTFDTFSEESFYLWPTREILQATETKRNSNYKHIMLNNNLKWNINRKWLFNYRLRGNVMKEDDRLENDGQTNELLLQNKANSISNLEHYLSLNYKPSAKQLFTFNAVQEVKYKTGELKINQHPTYENGKATRQELSWDTHNLRTYASSISALQKITLRADIGWEYNKQKLTLDPSAQDSLVRSMLYAKFGLRKGTGKLQYSLAVMGASTQLLHEQRKVQNRIFPQFTLTYKISQTHSLELIGLQHTDAFPLEKVTGVSYLRDFRWQRGAGQFSDLMPYVSSTLQFNYLNLSLYHGYMFYFSAAYQHADQSLAVETSTENQGFIQSYVMADIPQKRLYMNLSGDIRISPLQHKIYVRAFGMNESGSIKTNNTLLKQQHQHLWYQVGWNSYFKREWINYELAFSQRIIRTIAKKQEPLLFNQKTFLLTVQGKPGRWEYELSNRYLLYQSENESVNRLWIDFMVKYRIKRSKWSLGMRGQNIMQIDESSAVKQVNEAGVTYETIYSQLPGFVGAFVEFRF